MTRRSELLRSIGHQACCSVTRAAEMGCTVVLPSDSRQWLCLSGTNYQANHGYSDKLCDFILFWERQPGLLWLATIELKGRSFNARNVGKQLQNGADVAETLLGGKAAKFAPVLVHRAIKTIELRELRKVRIGFRGTRQLIQSKNSGLHVSAIDWG